MTTNPFNAYLVTLLLSTWTAIASAEIVPFDSERWEFHGGEHRVEQFGGQQALYLKGGKAVLPDVSFVNGVIEYDVYFTSDFSPNSTLADNRAFVGAVFRLQDIENFEKFYMRPHRTPSEEDGAQYVPVYNDWSSWQLFWDGHIAAVDFQYDTWTHIKLLMADKYLEVYIGDMTTPVLTAELKRPVTAGHIGLKLDPTPATAYAYFANFSYELNDSPAFSTTPPDPQTAAAGTVLNWMVSTPFAQADLDDKMTLTEADRNALTWTALAADASTGITNLSMAHKITTFGRGDGKNTVFARTLISSDRRQTKKLQFGFTDIAKLYLNGKLLYSESNLFRSRNKNFMGTTGYYNEVYLPLKPGANELWIAVTGIMASWGVQARLADDDLTGLSFDPQQMASLDASASKLDYCTATYHLSGAVHIPCVAVPTGNGEEYNLFAVDMKQPEPTDFRFELDLETIQAH